MSNVTHTNLPVVSTAWSHWIILKQSHCDMTPVLINPLRTISTGNILLSFNLVSCLNSRWFSSGLSLLNTVRLFAHESRPKDKCHIPNNHPVVEGYEVKIQCVKEWPYLQMLLHLWVPALSNSVDGIFETTILHYCRFENSRLFIRELWACEQNRMGIYQTLRNTYTPW